MLHFLLYIIIPSLLMSEPTDEHFYSGYGHAALRFQCPELETDFVYDYAGERMDNRFPAFMAGRLKMGLEVMETEAYLAREVAEVHEYPMTISDTLLYALCTVLDSAYRAGFNRKYDPVTGSCCLMLYRYMNEASRLANIPIRYGPWTEDYDMSIRELSAKYSTHCPWTDVMYNTLGDASLSNRNLSKPRKVLYPEQLLERWQSASIITNQYSVIKAGLSSREPSTCSPFLVAGILVALAALFMFTGWKPLQVLFMVLIGAMGLLQTYLLCFSQLPHTGWNCLLLPFNLLPLIFWHWRCYWSLPYAAALAIVILYVNLQPIFSPQSSMSSPLSLFYILVSSAIGLFYIGVFFQCIKEKPLRLWNMEIRF